MTATTPDTEDAGGGTGGEKGGRMTWPATVSLLFLLLGAFNTGYNMTALNSPGQLIMDFMNETSVSRGDGEISHDTLTSLYGLLSAIFAIGAGIGALSMQKLADWTGRKRLAWLSAVVGVVSAALMGVSKVAGSFEVLFVARFVIGLVAGLMSGLGPVYYSEVLPARAVGRAVLANTVTLQLGSLVAAIGGLEFVFATSSLWIYIFVTSGAVFLLQLLIAPFAVPSPYFLLLKSREQEAANALKKLKGAANVKKEMSTLKAKISGNRSKQEEMTVVQLLKSRKWRKSLGMMVMSFISMLFTGIVVVVFYSVAVLQAAGLSEHMARNVGTAVASSSVIVSVVVLTVIVVFYSVAVLQAAGLSEHMARNVGTAVASSAMIVSVVVLTVVQRLPRRLMHLGGLGGLFVCGGVLTLALVFGEKGSWLNIVGVIALVSMAGSHSFGPGQVPWLMVAELFDDHSRGSASSVCVMTMWLSLFVIGYIFPPMQGALGAYSVLPFVSLSAFFFVFFLVLQPETKGRAMQGVSDVYVVDSPETPKPNTSSAEIRDANSFPDDEILQKHTGREDERGSTLENSTTTTESFKTRM